MRGGRLCGKRVSNLRPTSFGASLEGAWLRRAASSSQTRDLRILHLRLIVLFVIPLWLLAGATGFLGTGEAAEPVRQPLDLVFVLDVSGSMKQSDPQRALVQAVGGLVARLGRQDAAGLVVFGGQARAPFPLAVLTTDEKRQALLAEIGQLRYVEPRTNMAAGVERGLYELRQQKRATAIPALVFLTDGIMDTGSAAKDAEMREWLRARLLPEARELGIRFFSIALTEQADYAMMQEFAAATRGDYFRALGSVEIAPIFEKIYARVGAPAAPPPPSPGTAASPPLPPTAPSGWSVGLWAGIAGGIGLAAALAFVLLRRRDRPAGREAAAPAPGGTEKTLLAAKPAGGGPHALAYLSDIRTGKPAPLIIPITRIGRAADNDLVISEPQVSSHHAEVELRGSRFFLRDLRSTNGTWVNTQRIEGEAVLRPGDVIRFDEFSYTFFGPTASDAGLKGTMIREVPATSGTPVVPPPAPAAPPPPAPVPPPAPSRPRSSSATLVETALLDTIDDRTGPHNCPFHPNFEATERCDRCGRLWCALCNPPLVGERVCRTCREAAKTGGRPDGSPTGRAPGYL